MLVKEVVALAAANLGRDDLAKEAENYTKGTLGDELADLVRCYNLVENEIALDFFPLKKTERLAEQKGKIEYTNFSLAPVNVHKVTDAEGVPVRFDIHPAYLVLPVGSGAVDVTYSYSPAKKEILDETEFSDKISARLLSFGVASEFCITNRQFSEGTMWGRRYRAALNAAGILRRTLSVRSRRWI